MGKVGRLTTIIGIRVSPFFKQMMKEEAKRQGKTLSGFLSDCIDAGLAVITQNEQTNVKQDQGISIDMLNKRFTALNWKADTTMGADNKSIFLSANMGHF